MYVTTLLQRGWDDLDVSGDDPGWQLHGTRYVVSDLVTNSIIIVGNLRSVISSTHILTSSQIEEATIR